MSPTNSAKSPAKAKPLANTKVRVASTEELLFAGQLLCDFYQEFGDTAPEPDWTARHFASMVASGEMCVYLAGHPAVGLAVVRFRPALMEEGLEAYLAELYLKPDRRSEGIGRALMDFLMADARKRGVVEMFIGVDQDDGRAMRFYERLGFTNHYPTSGTMFHYEQRL